MNKDTMQGQWQQMKGSVKQKWGRLTDDDLTEIDGATDKLTGRIQELYGLQREEAERQVKLWMEERNRAA